MIISTNHPFPPRDNLEFNPKVCPPLLHYMSVPKHLATDLLITDDYIAGHFCITCDLDIFFLLYPPTSPVLHYQPNHPQINKIKKKKEKKKKKKKKKKKLVKIDPASPLPLTCCKIDIKCRFYPGDLVTRKETGRFVS